MGLALKIWMGTGLWKRGIQSLLEDIMPPGPDRNLALAHLDKQFTLIDNNKGATGILQMSEMMMPM